MKKTQIKEKENLAHITGIVTVKSYVAGTIEKAMPFFQLAKDMRALGKKIPFEAARQKAQEIMQRGYQRTEVVQKNLVMQAANLGNDLIIQRLASINTYSLNITFGEIGTGNTTPTTSDAALTTPVARSGTSYSDDYGNTKAIVQFFFADGNLPNQTYYEFGTFVDGVLGTIGSGQMFNHALFVSPYVKASSQDTTVEVDFTVS